MVAGTAVAAVVVAAARSLGLKLHERCRAHRESTCEPDATKCKPLGDRAPAARRGFVMRLEQSEKELAAIGASVGANCLPCITHHIAAGRKAGLSEHRLREALAIAEAVRDEAVTLLTAAARELLGAGCGVPDPSAAAETSQARELVALGASIGANSHALLDVHVASALDTGLTERQIEAALKLAEYVQQRAGGITADRAQHILEELGGATRAETELQPAITRR